MGQTNLKYFFSLFQHSGGWVYHQKYLRYGRNWKEFQSQLNLWLKTHIDPKLPLLLIGPSAGYNLSDSFLQNFTEIAALEIDPWARWIWKIHHQTQINLWSDQNFFHKAGTLNERALQEIEIHFPGYQMLFCNFLGQLGFLSSMDDAKVVLLRQSLQKLQSPWWSFHDLYSLHGSSKDLRKFSRSLPKEFCRSDVDDILASAPSALKISDHWTREMIPESKNSRLFPWFLTKNSLHLVEATGNT